MHISICNTAAIGKVQSLVENEEDSAIEEWKNATVKWFPAEILNLSLKPFSLNFLSGQDRWERQLLLNFL